MTKNEMILVAIIFITSVVGPLIGFSFGALYYNGNSFRRKSPRE